MKARITLFNLKGKPDIWWEDVKNVEGKHEENFTCHVFEMFVKKEYFSKRYYDDKAYKEFYELGMGSMTYKDYTSIYLESLRHGPYLKEEKAKVQRFINGFPIGYKDTIEFDYPRSLEEAIQNLKH